MSEINAGKFENMAHKVDMPDAFLREIRGSAKAIAEISDPRIKTVNLVNMYKNLNEYKRVWNLDDNVINIERIKKFQEKGGFSKRIVQSKEGMEPKLVRDNIKKLYPKDKNGVPYDYRKAEKNEFLQLLDRKVAEELEELLQVNTTSKDSNTFDDLKSMRTEEIIDILEVLEAVIVYNNLSRKEIDVRVQSLETYEAMQKRDSLVGKKRKLKN